MTAGEDEPKVALGLGLRGLAAQVEERRVEVPLQVMDGVEGEAAGVGDRLAEREADQ